MQIGVGVGRVLVLAFACACESAARGPALPAAPAISGADGGQVQAPLTLNDLAWTPGAHVAQNFVPGNCCVARDEPGCEVERVQACVCEFRPSCCQSAWTEGCTELVSSKHCASCGGRGLAGPECGTSACNESWCGSEYENQCPDAWALDPGCDCGCQFEDPKCQEPR